MTRHHFSLGCVLAGAAAFAVMTASQASAQTAPLPRPSAPAAVAQPAQPQPPAQPALRRGAPGAQALGLTEDQKTKIKALRETQQKELQASREGVRTARQKLAELRRADTFDEQVFRAAAMAVASAEADLTVAQARQRAQYLALLTPEQQARVKQRQAIAQREARMFAQREARGYRNGFREGMMRGLRQQRGGRMGRDWSPLAPGARR